MAVVVVVNAVSEKNDDDVLDRPLRPLLLLLTVAAVRLLLSLLFIDGDGMVADFCIIYNSVSGCGVIPIVVQSYC